MDRCPDFARELHRSVPCCDTARSTPAGNESSAAFPDNLRDPRGLTPDGTGVPVIVRGNPNLRPEVAYEWSYGAVYSPKRIKGLTLSSDFWHIDLRSIASFVDPQF